VPLIALPWLSYVLLGPRTKPWHDFMTFRQTNSAEESVQVYTALQEVQHLWFDGASPPHSCNSYTSAPGRYLHNKMLLATRGTPGGCAPNTRPACSTLGLTLSQLLLGHALPGVIFPASCAPSIMLFPILPLRHDSSSAPSYQARPLRSFPPFFSFYKMSRGLKQPFQCPSLSAHSGASGRGESRTGP